MSEGGGYARERGDVWGEVVPCVCHHVCITERGRRRVRQVAHVRTCHLPCAARLLNRSSSPSGALQTIPDERFDEPARTLRVEEKFDLRGQISPHMAGISSLGRRGCSHDGRGKAGAAERDTADDFLSRRCCSAPRGAMIRRQCVRERELTHALGQD